MSDHLWRYKLDAPPRPRDKEHKRLREQFDKQFAAVEKPLAFEEVFSNDHLSYAYLECKRGGQAAGPDGITYGQLSKSDARALTRALEASILAGTYGPGERSTTEISKPSGGTRPLRIGPIQDRVVSKAQLHAFSPRWECRFESHSYGFRPGRSLLDVLAQLEVMLQRSSRRVVAIADVENAFGNVAVERVLQLQRAMLLEDGTDSVDVERFMGLLEKMLCHKGKQPVGIDQGDPLSPLLLNMILDSAHDAPLQQERHSPFWLRYADNLVYPCQNVPEGHQVLELVAELLDAVGMRLKNTSLICDLGQGESAELLGLQLSYSNNRLHLQPTQATEAKLREHLAQAHQSPTPTATAKRSLLGWVKALGLAYPRAEDCIQLALSTAATLGFRELGSQRSLLRAQEKSCQRWEKARAQAQTTAGEFLLSC